MNWLAMFPARRRARSPLNPGGSRQPHDRQIRYYAQAASMASDICGIAPLANPHFGGRSSFLMGGSPTEIMLCPHDKQSRSDAPRADTNRDKEVFQGIECGLSGREIDSSFVSVFSPWASREPPIKSNAC